jgi:hypothetical protein
MRFPNEQLCEQNRRQGMAEQSYSERAQAERAAAEGAVLPLVRDRHLRSAEGWQNMADRQDAVAVAKSTNDKARRASAQLRREEEQEDLDLDAESAVTGSTSPGALSHDR